MTITECITAPTSMKPSMSLDSLSSLGKTVENVGKTVGKNIDFKQWFVNVITPDFDTTEARVRCGSLDDKDNAYTPAPSLQGPTLLMRAATHELNPKQEPLLYPERRPMYARWFSPLEPGSVRSCSAALAATSLGAGALALPYAFSLVGIGLGIVTLTAAGLVSSLSLQILMVAARYTGTQSYATVLELAVGSRFASAVLDFVVLLNGIGAITSILIFEGDFLPAVLASPPGMNGYILSRETAVMAAAAAVWPLTLPSDISALRYVAVAVPLVLLTTIAIVLYDAPALYQSARDDGEPLVWWDFQLQRWLQACAIMVNAFANHTNAVPCANQLTKPSVARVVKATVNGNLMVWFLLMSLGIGGYMSWGGATKGDFLLNYPEGLAEIWFCRLMLAIIVYLVLPVALLPTAKSGAELLLSIVPGSRRGEVGPKMHAVSATLLLAFCTAIAVNVSNVASVLGLLGGLLASSLMFWFPALVFRWLLWPTQPRQFRYPVLVALIFFGMSGWASVAVSYF